MIEDIHVEIKPGFALQKNFSARRIIHQQIRHKFKNLISKVLDFERSFVLQNFLWYLEYSTIIREC